MVLPGGQAAWCTAGLQPTASTLKAESPRPLLAIYRDCSQSRLSAPTEEPLLCLQLFHWILEYLRAVNGGEQHLHLPRDDVPLLKSLLREAEHFQLPGVWAFPCLQPIRVSPTLGSAHGGGAGGQVPVLFCLHSGPYPTPAGSGGNLLCHAPVATAVGLIAVAPGGCMTPAALCWAHGMALGPQSCAANHTTPLADRSGQAFKDSPCWVDISMGAFQLQLVDGPQNSHCPMPQCNMLGTHQGAAPLLA